MTLLWVREGRGLVGYGTLLRTEIPPGAERYRRVGEAAREGFEAGRERAFASLTFDETSPGSVVVVPERIAEGPVEGPDAAVPKIRYAGSTLSEVGWLEAIDLATKRIAADELQKVVLARDVHVWAKEELDAGVLAGRLMRRFPSCYTFAIDGFVGATPELLVRRTGRAIESLVLAGTVGRGASEVTDAALGEWLLASGKDAREHRFAVESVTSVLAEICDEVIASGPRLLKLENVQHLATRIQGKLARDTTVLEAVRRLHPTAAVCGTPRAVALETIRALEGMDRGRYAGPVGWFDASGDGEFGIALRCAEVGGTRARLFAGAGIVAGSLPESELEETRLKLRAMQSALES